MRSTGSAPAYKAIFRGEFPKQDTGLDCTNNQPANSVAACGSSCSANVACRYFYAGSNGRCCLKSAYDSSSGMVKRVQGDFYELTTRGPMPPPPPPPGPGVRSDDSYSCSSASWAARGGGGRTSPQTVRFKDRSLTGSTSLPALLSAVSTDPDSEVRRYGCLCVCLTV